MPILERTPPRRRLGDGVDAALDSSPSRARHDRSVEKAGNAASNGGDYVFPSLDAMAAPIRERNAAMTHSRSWTPSMSAHINGSGRKEFGSLGSGSGRKLGSLSGRNAPIKTATAGSIYPSLGETSVASSSRSPQRLQKRESHVSRGSVDLAASSQIIKLYPSIQQHDSDERPLRGPSARSSTEMGDDRKAFEAQMEKALASGANPFQDRKRDQMRDEGGRSSVAHQTERHANGTSHRRSGSTPRQDVVPSAKIQHEYASPLKILSPPRSQLEMSPQVSTAPIPASPRFTARARDDHELQEKDAANATLRTELASKQSSLTEMQNAVKKYQDRLSEGRKLSRDQEARIKALESKLQRVTSASKDQSATDLVSHALSWELSRVQCRNDWDREEKSRQRDLEAIICRNELTCMEGRRAEAESQSQMHLIEMEEVELVLQSRSKQMRQLKSTLADVERSRDELGNACRDLEEREAGLLAELDAERSQREAMEIENSRLEQEIKTIKAKAEEDRIEFERKERVAAATKRDTGLSTSRLATKDMPSSPAKRRVAAPIDKVSNASSTQPRQSPRKQVMEKAKAVVAKGVKRKSSLSVQSDKGMEEVSEQSMSFDAEISYKEPMKAASFTKKSNARQAAEAPPSEEIVQPEEEEAAYVEPVKKVTKVTGKKASLLDRGKAAAATKKGIAIKKREAEVETAEEADNLTKTPVLMNKKSTSTRQKQVKAAVPDESFNADATPILPAKPKRQSKEQSIQQEQRRSMGLSDDEEDVENMTPVVPSKRAIDQQSKLKASAAPQVTTTEVKKKKRRLLKPTTNIANGFLNVNGDGEGDLDPKLNLPLQLSPLKDDLNPTSSSLLGRRGHTGGSLTAAAGRLFGR